MTTIFIPKGCPSQLDLVNCLFGQGSPCVFGQGNQAVALIRPFNVTFRKLGGTLLWQVEVAKKIAKGLVSGWVDPNGRRAIFCLDGYAPGLWAYMFYAYGYYFPIESWSISVGSPSQNPILDGSKKRSVDSLSSAVMILERFWADGLDSTKEVKGFLDLMDQQDKDHMWTSVVWETLPKLSSHRAHNLGIDFFLRLLELTPATLFLNDQVLRTICGLYIDLVAKVSSESMEVIGQDREKFRQTFARMLFSHHCPQEVLAKIGQEFLGQMVYADLADRLKGITKDFTQTLRDESAARLQA